MVGSPLRQSQCPKHLPRFFTAWLAVSYKLPLEVQVELLVCPQKDSLEKKKISIEKSMKKTIQGLLEDCSMTCISRAEQVLGFSGSVPGQVLGFRFAWLGISHMYQRGWASVRV